MSTPDIGSDPLSPVAAIDTAAQPVWRRTGNKHFPYAAHQSGHWWILRANHGFPEHGMFILFGDGRAAADITTDPEATIPMLDSDTADAVITTVAGYADYGSEHVDPCPLCSSDT